MSWDSTDYSVLYDNIFVIALALLVTGAPFFVYSFYACHHSEMDEDDFTVAYGTLYDGLMLSRKREKEHTADRVKHRRYQSIFYPFWFVTRRFLFALSVVIFEDQFWLQASIGVICCFISALYLVRYKPFECHRMLACELVNEACQFVLLQHVMFWGFTGEAAEPNDYIGLAANREARYDWGTSFIVVGSLNIFF